jgi:hypothetical protein
MARDPIIREATPRVTDSTDETPHGCYEGWVYLGVEGRLDREVFAEAVRGRIFREYGHIIAPRRPRTT